jgi:hypothetical protein
MIILKLITRNMCISIPRLRPIVPDVGDARRHQLKLFCRDKREWKSGGERLRFTKVVGTY